MLLVNNHYFTEQVSHLLITRQYICLFLYAGPIQITIDLIHLGELRLLLVLR
jgi:hypothetical protein